MLGMSDETTSCSCCGKGHEPEALTGFQGHQETRLCRGCIEWLSIRAGNPKTTPILATVDMAASQRFYRSAGFSVDVYDDGYAFVLRGSAEVLHLAGSDVVDADRNAAACYFNAPEADLWHAAWSAAGLPVGDITDQPWGMREFEVTDPSGNLLRVGRNI